MADFEGKLKNWGYIDTLIGIGTVFIGLFGVLILEDPYGILIIGLGLFLIVLIYLCFFVIKEEPRDTEKETTTVTKTKNDEKPEKEITEKVTLSKLKWENYSKVERAYKLLGIFIIIFGLSFVVWVGLKASEPYMGIGIIGLGSFIVVLAGAFCLSDKWNLHAGEFRKALTISIISVYFSTLAFSNQIITSNMTSNGSNLTNSIGFINSTGTYTLKQWTLVEPVFNNLWAIVIAVIGFYFFTGWIDKWKKE